MLIIDSFGKNVYIGDDLVGYIGENCIYINGHKFADLSDDGIISYGKRDILPPLIEVGASCSRILMNPVSAS